ncbi:DUF222 domain-containing protein [Microbacterium sp.]|uniref:HNH endonuclease n=1 Tax=Microbacterium sp. TaxID=51671 RepID=UPI0039E50213
MSTPLAGIAEALTALAAAGGDRSVESLSPGELVAVNEAFGALRRQVDAAMAPIAAEIARQSRSALGKDSLARKQGFRSPESMISAVTGVPVGEAKRLVQVGEATAPQLSLLGEVLPDKHPHVAVAVREGRLGVTAAAAIVGLLDRIGPRADREAAAEMEAHLVQAAPGLRPDQLAKLLARAEAQLDPGEVARKSAEIHADRSLTISERDGALRLVFVSDAVAGAPVKVAIEGMVTAVFRRNERMNEQGGDEAEADQRSVRQIQADALIEFCRHALACTQVPTLPTTTVVVRMDLDALRTGVGNATIDGIDQPVDAGRVRRLAADLQVVPVVLGGESEILDLGRARRLFTPALRLALAERDGGCVGCGAPPDQCIAHHLRWWCHGGRTDLANGVLLCVACHHRLHDDGWEVRVEGPGIDAKVWMIPPPWIDPERTPRLGGRHRYDLVT